jgi:SAM-dependent methyltransferase
MGFWSYCFGWRKLDIRPGDLVLEVGPGPNPMIRSDVLVDKSPPDDIKKGSGLSADRPLVIADICALPFKNKVFDYAYTARTLEHVDKIERALSELQRVAKRGYIIVPQWYIEGLWNTHFWLISKRGDTLVFRRKCHLFNMTLLEYCQEARDLFWKLYTHHRLTFEIHYEWNGKINYEIIRCGCEDFRPTAELVLRETLSIKSKLRRFARIAVTRFLRWWWARTGELNPKIRSSSPNLFAPYSAPTSLDIGSDRHEP